MSFLKNGDTYFEFLCQYLLNKIASPYFTNQAVFCLFRMITQFCTRQTIKSLLSLSRSETQLLEATVTFVDSTKIRVK